MKNKKSETKYIGHELCKALTEKQIEVLLDSLFGSVDKQSLPEILSSLDEVIAFRRRAEYRSVPWLDRTMAQGSSSQQESLECDSSGRAGVGFGGQGFSKRKLLSV